MDSLVYCKAALIVEKTLPIEAVAKGAREELILLANHCPKRHSLDELDTG